MPGTVFGSKGGAQTAGSGTTVIIVDAAAKQREFDESQRALKGRVDSAAQKQSAALKAQLVRWLLLRSTRPMLKRQTELARLYEHPR
jgi:hypothetical protein